jgi:hypothetical protein
VPIDVPTTPFAPGVAAKAAALHAARQVPIRKADLRIERPLNWMAMS